MNFGLRPADAEILNFAIVNNYSQIIQCPPEGSLSTSDHSTILLTIRGPLEADEIKPNFIYHEVENFFKIT
jgi:hypothetical protein